MDGFGNKIEKGYRGFGRVGSGEGCSFVRRPRAFGRRSKLKEKKNTPRNEDGGTEIHSKPEGGGGVTIAKGKPGFRWCGKLSNKKRKY